MDYDELKMWVLSLFQLRDDKITKLSELLSEHKMALKILGVGLCILIPAIITIIAALIPLAFQVWGGK